MCVSWDHTWGKPQTDECVPKYGGVFVVCMRVHVRARACACVRAWHCSVHGSVSSSEIPQELFLS